MNIKVSNLSIRYPENIIFDNFNVEFEENKITVILGESGVGKTTLLNCLSGLIKYEGNVEGVKTISYVFPDNCLIKGLTIEENVDFVLKGIIKNKSERKAIIDRVISEVELCNSIKKYPTELSTGMAQRVGIARAFAYPSDTILMDEPFRGLDLGVKNRIINTFNGIWNRQSKTVVMITHSIDEAILMADRIIIIDGKPAKIIYDKKLDVPRGKRDLSSQEFSSLIAEIYKKII